MVVRKRVLYTAPNMLATSMGFGGDCGRAYHTIQTLYCPLNSKVCFLLPQLIVV